MTQLNQKDIDSVTKSLRVFFALFPDPLTQKQLSLQADKLEPVCGGRKIKPQRLHLTLLFLGEVAVTRIEALKQTMATISASKFEIRFDTVRYWKHNKIISLQAADAPAELFALVNLLKIALTHRGFAFDNRDYKPHITLLRKSAHPVQTHRIQPISLIAAEWFLVQSKAINNHVDYAVLGHWPLK